jgi:uncharacterized Rmd1/YagE family protein
MATTETSPLLPQYQRPTVTNTSPQADRPTRTVTFNPLTTISTYNDGVANSTTQPLQSHSPPPHVPLSGQPMLSALNSKLRRRNSHGAPFTQPGPVLAGAKIGPQRTTKNAQKLKLLPDPETGEEDDDTVEDGAPRDVYTQLTRIKEPSARRDAARLGKADRDRLPRVTAYCTANAYRLDGVIRFLKSRSKTRGANPKLYDECVYSPYNYEYESKAQQGDPSSPETSRPLANILQPPPNLHSERRYSDSAVEIEGNTKLRREDLIDLQDEASTQSRSSESVPSSSAIHERTDLDTTVHTPEIFLFDYGTVVLWGLTPAQESRFLADVSKFATTILSPEDTQVEKFNFYYARDYQARIYNDFISLRDPRNHMSKLAISHALSQSVKTSLFEDLVSETISKTAPLPAEIAKSGKVNMTRKQINMQIGELFILRINIHLQGSVLDSPELMWAEPQLEPVYLAVRSYLEMDQRVGLLTERLDVIADLLAVLKDQLSHHHSEYLEWIGTYFSFHYENGRCHNSVLTVELLLVIILIGAEILVAGINIIVDLYAGVD